MYNDTYEFKTEVELRQICKPLFEKSKISFFEYGLVVKSNLDVKWLSTNPQRTQLLLDKQSLAKSTVQMVSDVKEKNFRYYFWDSVLTHMKSELHKRKMERYLSMSYNYFDVAHGFVIIEHSNDHSMIYSFGTTVKNESVREFYLNNIDFLENFIFYFKEKSAGLFKKCGILGQEANQSIELLDIQCASKNILDQKLFNRDLQRLYLTFDTFNNVYLTTQEFKIILLISKCYTLDEIGAFLNTSTRTVESHLKAARDRLNLQTNADLILLFWRSPLSKLALAS